ncbi:MAG: glycosyltransferase family 39 protein [Candidatus Solibacter usitatus]|nr:glycosyltransferase family 39 protein [Candidatus Solibacter usitatus]
MKNSGRSRRSKKSSGAQFGFLDVAGVCLLLAVISAAAIAWHYAHGYLLYYGDAQAHLGIARRVIDSRTPGPMQIGTVWLPLPHLLMLPFVRVDSWWRSGLAGAIPSGICFVIAGGFLYAAVRRLFTSQWAALAAVLLLAANPNMLYLQSIPMTEPVFLAALMGLLYAMVWFRQRHGIWPVLLGAVFSLTASFTRYEGWFLLPFAALYFAVTGGKQRWWMGMLFGALASLAPLAWLAHNWWYYGNVLEFYDGPYSAQAIYQRALQSGMDRYPGDHDWTRAFAQYAAAAQLCAGGALPLLAAAGFIAALWKRAFWVLGFLALPSVFYVWSLYGSGTPIYVPHLWPNSYYNTRYGLAAFPLLVLCAASLVAVIPARMQMVTTALVVFVAALPWLVYPRAENWICWKESQVNSETRRAWTREAAAYIGPRYRSGEGIYTSFGDMAGIFREAGIPLKETLYDGNHPLWNAVEQRPDLFLNEEWAIAMSGDTVSNTLLKADRLGRRYIYEKIVEIKNAPVIEIYRRQSSAHENPIHESARGAQ